MEVVTNCKIIIIIKEAIQWSHNWHQTATEQLNHQAVQVVITKYRDSHRVHSHRGLQPGFHQACFTKHQLTVVATTSTRMVRPLMYNMKMVHMLKQSGFKGHLEHARAQAKETMTEDIPVITTATLNKKFLLLPRFRDGWRTDRLAHRSIMERIKSMQQTKAPVILSKMVEI